MLICWFFFHLFSPGFLNLFCMFKKNNQIISILGHFKGKSLLRTNASTKRLSDWKKKRYCNGLCNEPFTCLINCWSTWFGLFSIMCYDLKIFGVHGQNICCSNVQLVKMHTSSIATNHFYMCSYFFTLVLMQLGEEGGIEDQGVSSFTFGTNT